MDRMEFKRIAQYIEDVEENLGLLGAKRMATQYHLTKLHLAIQRLIRASTETRDLQLRMSLATLKHRACKCMQCIEARLTVKC